MARKEGGDPKDGLRPASLDGGVNPALASVLSTVWALQVRRGLVEHLLAKVVEAAARQAVSEGAEHEDAVLLRVHGAAADLPPVTPPPHGRAGAQQPKCRPCHRCRVSDGMLLVELWPQEVKHCTAKVEYEAR